MLTNIFSANAQKNYFSSPVHHDIKLAGSFGELRSNHFHAGIDIKSTQGKSGDPILAAADGYISRIKISNTGYGKCIYLDHPNGYTTVYAHLDKFTPEIEKIILEKQRMLQKYEVDLYFKSPTFTYKKGQRIGTMGNTGRSYGPHLHFEIRETLSEIPQNPFAFGIAPDDTQKPIIQNINIIELTPDYQILDRKPIDFKKRKDGKYIINDRNDLTSDLVGISIKGFDRMNGASNKNGIYSVQMLVNDTLKYAYKTDAISFHHMKNINAHIDYAHKQRGKGTYANCYILPGDELNIYDRRLGKGTIHLNTRKKIRIIAMDFHGNMQEISFEIDRALEHKSLQKTFNKIIQQGQKTNVKAYTSTIHFPAKSLAKNLYFNYSESTDEKGYKNFIIGEKTTPLLQPIRFQTEIKNLPHPKDKIVLLYMDSDDPEAYPVQIKENTITALLDKLGTYKVGIDTFPPEIKHLPTASKSFVYYNVTHHYNIHKYKDFKYNVYIDDKWVPARWDTMKDRIVISIKSLSKGPHNIKIVASDASKNRTKYLHTIMIK